ncbi:hypothetical protein M0804_014896, partial [Polistes exclamans]
EVGNFLSKQRNQVICNNIGQWEPQPIQCFPKCGVVPPKSKPLIIGGNVTDISQFPWHATLYREKTKNGSKDFICGATIIEEKFLLTAAHCVYDETIQSINDPNKYYIATGNVYRDYDSKQHDKRFVKKARVKDIYVPCNYLGYEGNYAWDIAILEIDQPFVLSSSLLPACLNDDIVESGLGVTSGFGRTAFGSSSFILQSVSLPYVPLSECKSSKNSLESVKLITMDKFCAGYTNGTAVCDGDSGGGLVFQIGNLWYLRGIISLSFDYIPFGGTTICDSHSYTLYTRISNHIKWIQDTLFQLETSKSLPACREPTIANVTTTSPAELFPTSTSTITSSPSIRNTTVCTVPPDPANGYRLLHKSYCQTQEDCTVEEGMQLVSGSLLTYTCNQEYELNGTSDVLCSPEGDWINIPVCIGTITKISCKPGYNKYPRVQADNTMELICKRGGYWLEDPMECLPVPLRSLWVTADQDW